MKIYKTLKGEKFTFKAYFIPRQMKANVRWLMSDDPVEYTITDDFKYLIVPEDKAFRFYKDGKDEYIRKFKLDTRAQIEAKEYQTL